MNNGFKFFFGTIAVIHLNGCIFINKGFQSLPGILLVALGIGLLYAGFKIVWKYAGKDEVPPLMRFIFGMIAAIMILVA